MNRRSFFAKLATSLIAGPAAIRALTFASLFKSKEPELDIDAIFKQLYAINKERRGPITYYTYTPRPQYISLKHKHRERLERLRAEPVRNLP